MKHKKYNFLNDEFVPPDFWPSLPNGVTGIRHIDLSLLLSYPISYFNIIILYPFYIIYNI